MKRGLALLLLSPLLAMAADTCQAPAGWAEAGDEDGSWSSWSLDEEHAEAVSGGDWEQIREESMQQMAEAMDLSVEELQGYFAEMEQRQEAMFGQIQTLEEQIAAILREHADRLQQRGDNQGLVSAALLMLNSIAPDPQHAQTLIAEAVGRDGSDTAAHWAATLICTDPSGPCSGVASARTLARLEPDNIAAWWALARYEGEADETVITGTLAASRYADASQALRGRFVEVYARIELPTALQADLARTITELLGPTATAMADNILLASALATMEMTTATPAWLRRACWSDSDTGIGEPATLDVCREHYRIVAEQADGSGTRQIAYEALARLAGEDEAESARWRNRIQSLRWNEFQFMKAQSEGRIKVDEAFFQDFIELGTIEAARLHLNAIGAALDPPQDWDPEKAMMEWMGESIRASR